jgi:hypothetical protein
MILDYRVTQALETWYEARKKGDNASENYAITELKILASRHQHSFSIFQLLQDYEKKMLGVVETQPTPPLSCVKGDFECDECQKSFPTQNALNGHKRVHTK